MKLVRESLNEIRQDKESGLAGLGIGKEAALSVYKTILKRWNIKPDHITVYLRFSVVKNKKLAAEWTEKISKTLGTSTDKMIWIAEWTAPPALKAFLRSLYPSYDTSSDDNPTYIYMNNSGKGNDYDGAITLIKSDPERKTAYLWYVEHYYTAEGLRKEKNEISGWCIPFE